MFAWILMFIGFGTKIPLIPLHVWLPEAHVEAPTPGSVILASILLKLGSYALLRLLVQLFLHGVGLTLFIVLVLALCGFIYSSLTAFSQIDIKKIIAYSSIAHMNFTVIGLFCSSIIGIVGTFYLMIGHAITAGALFMAVGVLYDRYKTRLILYYGSLVIFMPVFALLFLICILSNFGFPGTVNFVGEFYISIGGFLFSNVIVGMAAFGMVLSLVYSLLLYNRIFFGVLQESFIRFYVDCIRLEFIILGVFVSLIIIFGLFPNIIVNISLLSLIKLVF